MAAGSGGGLADLVQAFLEFEEENGLFAVEVKGRRFWDCIRPYVVEKLLSRSGAAAAPAGKAGAARGLPYAAYAGRCVEGVWRGIVETVRPRVACDVAVVNLDRWNLIGGQRVNMNCFPLVKAMSPSHRILVVDPVEMRADAKLLYPESVVLSSGFHTVDTVKSLGVAYRKQERALFRQIQGKIRERFGVSVDIAELMRQHFSLHLVSCERFRRLFERHRPRAVVAAHHAYSAAEAAHEVGIPMIELQHSMISPFAMAYNYPASLRMPQVPTIPDVMFTFGEYWNDKFNMPTRKVAVGYPFFEAKAEEVRRRRPVNCDTATRSRSLIVISGYLAKAALVRATLELSRLLPESTIYYKLKFSDYHGWRDRYPEEFATRENIRVVDNDEVPLYEYFSMCSWALGVNSGGLYEAMAYGLTPFILKAGLYEESRDLYENGYAFLVEVAGEIAAAIQAGRRPALRLDRESFFKSDALENMVREIGEILKGSSAACSTSEEAASRHYAGSSKRAN